MPRIVRSIFSSNAPAVADFFFDFIGRVFHHGGTENPLGFSVSPCLRDEKERRRFLGRVAKRLQRFVLGVVHVEHGEQLGHLQQVAHTLGQSRKLDIRARIPGRSV